MAYRGPILILAGGYAEAMNYVRSRNLKSREYRIATSARALLGMRVSAIVELDGYRHRRDYHAVEAQVRVLQRKSGAPIERQYQSALPSGDDA